LSKWFLLLDKQPLPAALNMAVDEYLFHLCHQKKVGFFRLYAWEKPTFSFGVSQKITKAIDVDFIQQNNCTYVRRITGGKTVLHHHEITYAVISSENIFYKDNDLYRSYMLIATVLVNAFHALGLDAHLSKGSPSHLAKSNNPCFSFPTPNEIEIHGKKIVGSAQKRDNQALLQHGSIPISMDYELYAAGTHSRPAVIKKSMTTLTEVSEVPHKDKIKDDLINALIASFEDFIRHPLEVFEFEQKDEQPIDEIEKKYRSNEWNYKL
jgi:lipoate-protein ligase A